MEADLPVPLSINEQRVQAIDLICSKINQSKGFHQIFKNDTEISKRQDNVYSVYYLHNEKNVLPQNSKRLGKKLVIPQFRGNDTKRQADIKKDNIPAAHPPPAAHPLPAGPWHAPVRTIMQSQ